MKKIAALLLATAMMFTCAACGGGSGTDTENGGDADNGGTAKVEITDANDLLTKVWDEYNATAPEEVKFPSGGGNVENMVMEAPGTFDLTLEGAKDTLIMNFCLPAETMGMTDDIATLMHMMNANNFTCGAYHITDAANVETVITSIKDATLNNQWMCGFPEKLIIVTVDGDYVVSAFGNGQIIEAYKTAITTVFGDAAVVSVEESLAE